MTTKTILLALLIGLIAGAAAFGDIITVSLDTSPLLGHPAGPFSLEFQFIDGSGTGDGNNTVLLSGFTFGGGTASGVPTLTGGAAGTLSGGLSLTDSGFFNQAIEGFTPGSALSFQLSFTTNVDPGGTPDEFSFSILDSSGVEIPTVGPANALLILDIASGSPVPQVFATDPSTLPAGGGTGIDLGAPIVSTPPTVPEPGTIALLPTALIALLAVRRFWRREDGSHDA